MPVIFSQLFFDARDSRAEIRRSQIAGRRPLIAAVCWWLDADDWPRPATRD